jgi:hypothetical protein
MEASLISTDKLKKRGFIHGNVEDSILRVLIIRVQDTIIEPTIGTLLFKRLILGIDDDDLTADEITLMDDYIVPVMVAGCDHRSVNALTYQLRNKTVGTGSDDTIDAVSESGNVRIKDELKGDLVFYTNRLIGYLKDNCETFPLYKTYSCNNEDLKPNDKEYKANISIL